MALGQERTRLQLGTVLRLAADFLVDHRDAVRRVGKLLHDLQGAVHRKPFALRVDVVHQRAERRRLAALPLRMHDEVRHVLDETHDIRHTLGRRQHVMPFRIARPRDVEDSAHAAYYITKNVSCYKDPLVAAAVRTLADRLRSAPQSRCPAAKTAASTHRHAARDSLRFKIGSPPVATGKDDNVSAPLLGQCAELEVTGAPV